MRVFLSNLGCKLNQAEVDALARQFRARGHAVVGTLADADVHIVNSCTVTHLAARDSRKAARRGARERHRPRTVLTGCHATAQPEEAARLGVDLVVDNRDKDRLVELVARAFSESVRVGTARPAASGLASKRARPDHPADEPVRLLVRADEPAPSRVPVSYVRLEFGTARALVKVEDGCDMRCAFCVIPSTRGAQRSRPLREVVAEIRALE
ncbi:MAG TPA: hypothetical protein VMS86_11550, partial [Thermoanaerobaculia bacterium]|nr:hypothetical protein [Thermoanaerobaculia bacterium]